MEVRSKLTAPRYERDDIVSHLLVSELTTDARYLTTSLVEMRPGGKQHVHSHEPEQCYFIMEGDGVMTVGSETQRVVSGDCVFIPSNRPHGLKNAGSGMLRYFSAASPSFGKEALQRLWPKESGAAVAR